MTKIGIIKQNKNININMVTKLLPDMPLILEMKFLNLSNVLYSPNFWQRLYKKITHTKALKNNVAESIYDSKESLYVRV